METSNNGSSINDSQLKCLKMKELVEAINEYLRTRTENTAIVIRKSLQAYSVTIDASVFDPDASFGAQFYVSLYELLTKLEPHSQIAWDCVHVLSNACRNCSAREVLINTYQFVPCLSRLLGDQLSNVKKKKLLELMQNLTCGIKLSWQVPNLPHLLKTLTKWVEDKDKEIVCFSLGVLVNVCYKNLPAIYTLSRTVDMKKFLRFCLPLQGPLLEVNVCKLMIIIDNSHDEIPKKTLLNLIEPTFLSALESLTKNDPVMLRLVVDFFVDVVNSENAEIFKEYKHYNEQIDRLIQLINARNVTADPNSTPLAQHDPECVRLILKLIYTLEVNEICNFSTLYLKIIKLALDWVHSERVSYQALSVLTAITENTIKNDEEKNILQPLAAKLPVFLMALNSDSTPGKMDSCQRLGSLLRLLRIMLKAKSICNDVLQSITENILMKTLSPFLSDDFNLEDLPKLRVSENVTTSTDVVDTCVYALGLVNELSQHDASWLELLSTLMENSIIHSMLALALYGSESRVKQLVLEISRSPRFPIEKVSIAMESSQNMFSNGITSKSPSNYQPTNEMSYPILSDTQMEMLDETLKHFKKMVYEHSPADIPTKQVMELYEYKLATLAHSEISALKSVETASDRCIHLQHRLAQITTEHNKLRHLLCQTENRLEKMKLERGELQTIYLNSRKQTDEEKAKLEKLLAETENKLKETELELQGMTEMKNNLEDQYTKCKQLIQKLEETGNRVEKQLQKREEQLKNVSLHLDTVNLQKQDLEKLLNQKETKLAEVTRQYLASKEVINTITRVASSQLP